jgi:hypothetical protein
LNYSISIVKTTPKPFPRCTLVETDTISWAMASPTAIPRWPPEEGVITGQAAIRTLYDFLEESSGHVAYERHDTADVIEYLICCNLPGKGTRPRYFGKTKNSTGTERPFEKTDVYVWKP